MRALQAAILAAVVDEERFPKVVWCTVSIATRRSLGERVSDPPRGERSVCGDVDDGVSGGGVGRRSWLDPFAGADERAAGGAGGGGGVHELAAGDADERVDPSVAPCWTILFSFSSVSRAWAKGCGVVTHAGVPTCLLSTICKYTHAW